MRAAPNTKLSLYRILFHVKALLWESIVLSLPSPSCKAYPIAILLHDQCAICNPPTAPLLYAIHHTILAIVISCKGQRKTWTAGARGDDGTGITGKETDDADADETEPASQTCISALSADQNDVISNLQQMQMGEHRLRAPRARACARRICVFVSCDYVCMCASYTT